MKKLVLSFLVSVATYFAQDNPIVNLNYHRNDNAFLEQYKAVNKQKYFPLVQSTYSVGIWTELNPKVPRVDYIGIDFVNPDTGWAVGLYGAVIKTTNGGTNWQTIDVPTGEILLKVHSYNGQVVIVIGHNGTILRSDDGGNTFTLLSGITTQELWGVKMLNDSLGWICGRNQTLLKTTDAGLTWQNISTGYNYHYWSFDFLDADNFMIACSFGKILKTTNGGFNWTIYQAGNLEDLFTIDIIDSAHIAAAGSYGKNVYSSDGGTNWIEQQSTFQSMNWIQYVNRDTGYMVSENFGLYRTTNRGQNWSNPGFGNAGGWQFELLNNNLSYAVGAELTVTKTEDGFITGRNLILNKNWSDAFFITELTGFIGSINDFENPLYKTMDGANHINEVANFPVNTLTTFLNSILFIDDQIGFVTGYPSRIIKTIDGGTNWFDINRSGLNDTLGSILKIKFINESVGWAINSYPGAILKTTDCGENWSTQFIHPASGFTGISFTDSLNGWVSGARPQHTIDGGLTWIEQQNENLWNSDDVYFTRRDTGWIARYSTINTSLFKTTDGGVTWTDISEVVGARKFRFTQDPNHWLIIGFARYYMTYDNGNTWYEFTNDVPIGLTSFSMPTNNIGYAVGTLGLVLKFEDTIYVPVELASFTSSVYENDIILNWQTATETNNLGFQIERRKMQDERSEEWNVVSFVSGYGTTTEPQAYTFVDKNLGSGKYHYRLKQINFDGTFEYSNTIEVEINSPTKFSLEQNYPNPFNPNTIIRFNIPSVGTHRDASLLTTLKVFDVLGKEVATLVNEEKPAGNYEVKFNVVQESFPAISSGIYFYQLKADEYIETKKMILLK